MTSHAEAVRLMKADLSRSKLRDNEIKKLRLTAFSSSQTEELTGSKIPSYKIPYFDLQGDEIDNFFRIRYLEEPKQKASERKQKKLNVTPNLPTYRPAFTCPPST